VSLFEFTFGLSAVILGLALAQLASSYHRLAIAGRRVRWAAEPVLLSAIIFLVIVSVWLFQWEARNDTQTTIGLMLLQVLKLLLPFMAAAFVLPETIPETGEIDLLAHYERTRPFTYGALIAGLLLFWIHNLFESALLPGLPPLTLALAIKHAPWLYVGLYALLIFLRIRWLSIVLLAGGLLYYAFFIIGIELRS
jgi:hypothetical protein